MKRDSGRMWVCSLLALITTGCGIYMAPPLVGTPSIDTANVQRRLFATVESLGWNPTYVFSITPVAEGFQVSTSSSVQTLDNDGRVADVVRLDMPARSVFPLVRSRNADAPAVFAGADGPRNPLLIFDESGTRLGEAPPCYPTDLLVADIADDERPEVICAGGAIAKTLRIHRTDGSLLGTVDLGESVTGLRAFDTDGDGKDEIVVYTYPSGKGIGRFRVVGRGGVTHDWKLPAVGKFSVVELEDRNALLLLEDSAFVIRDIDGTSLLRFEDPSLSIRGFSRPQGARLPGGRWCFVSSGRGGFPYHLVAIFSGSELIYSEVRRGHSYAMLPIRDGDGVAVLVGGWDEIWKYSLP